MSSECIARVYKAEDIEKMLQLSHNKTYAFLHEVYKKGEPFKVLKIGKNIRVPRKEFDIWLQEM